MYYTADSLRAAPQRLIGSGHVYLVDRALRVIVDSEPSRLVRSSPRRAHRRARARIRGREVVFRVNVAICKF